ncbi:hypothetical protein [Desulfococcus multivorans]|uniref:Uncharacterized protein n=1 Tax=Desulfococcus multivorans DSM 2059 TaxID=1121405 RepID=S7V6U5_DESML|nr:hypothetical protein [Desulfococcus multivorans]AOY60436.1 conserved uncharacterized protein [Desulfococcus multivorans]AQV02528.1 hypothetical protein B2D07_18310 [Desulfococcus multivorans]EPR42379.1 hypothetical protein dsmv_1674 [Desulfococcus multivorans DSM 2059]SJZ61553.1 hypothetical protein SAMN02745446_01133 [Desulfococcus multivorans DSM 2059]
MKLLFWCCLAAVIGLFGAGAAIGGDVGSHPVVFDFQPIDEIAVTGRPSLGISGAIAGQQPFDAVDGSSVLAVTTNGVNRRITAGIDAPMPAHTVLEVRVSAPSGSGTGLGYAGLTPAGSAVVTGIGRVADAACAVTYRLKATASAGVCPSDAGTVTFALSD